MDPASPRALESTSRQRRPISTVTTHGGREQLEFLPGSVKTPFGAAPFPQPQQQPTIQKSMAKKSRRGKPGRLNIPIFGNAYPSTSGCHMECYRNKPPKNELGAANGSGIRGAWPPAEVVASRRPPGASPPRLSSFFSADNNRASRP